MAGFLIGGNFTQRLAVWTVRDCERITYQGTEKVEAG